MMVPTKNKKGTCGCGRTADRNSNCDGSHGLSESDWLRIKSDREFRQQQQQYTCRPKIGGGGSVK